MRVLNFQSPYRQGEAPYDIFKDRMSAICSIVSGIKGMIESKYNKGLIDTTIGQLNKSLSKQQQTDMIDLLNAEPTDIYPDEEKLNTMAGQFVDYANVMGKMRGREGMASPGMPTGMPTGMPGTSEIMLPKGSREEIFNAVKNMPGGQMDFAPILKYMEEHRPKFMGSFSPTEQWALNQAMGQPSQREQYMQDIKDAKTVRDFFAEPTGEKTWEQTLTEANEFIKNNPDYEITAMNPKTGSLSITKKTVKPEINWEELSKRTEEYGLKLTSMNVNPTTGNVSYGFGAGETMTWEETLAKANQFMKDNPDYEVTSTNPKTGSVTIEKKGTGTGLKTPTYTTAENIEKGFMEKVETVQDFGNELKRLQGLGIDTKTFETTEYFAGLMEKRYEEALSVIQYCMQGIQSGEEADKDGLNYRDTYKEWWEKANSYDQQYFNVTGKHLLTGE